MLTGARVSLRFIRSSLKSPLLNYNFVLYASHFTIVIMLFLFEIDLLLFSYMFNNVIYKFLSFVLILILACQFREETENGMKSIRLSENTKPGTEVLTLNAFPRRNFNIQALDGVSRQTYLTGAQWARFENCVQKLISDL